MQMTSFGSTLFLFVFNNAVNQTSMQEGENKGSSIQASTAASTETIMWLPSLNIPGTMESWPSKPVSYPSHPQNKCQP